MTDELIEWLAGMYANYKITAPNSTLTFEEFIVIYESIYDTIAQSVLEAVEHDTITNI